MSVADLKVRISANADAFDSGLKKMQKSFDRTVRKLERTGANLTQKVTLPIIGIAAAAGKTAIDFESAFAGVRKTVDATESEFSGLRKGILDMSKTLPTSADEIAGVAEAAGQLGISTDNILEFSKTMVMLGDATNLTADEAATSFARIANVMQLPQNQFDEMGSVVVDLGNNFATTEAEIVEFANRIAGSGKIAGLSASQVFAISTALSSVGIQAESGGTAVQKALLNMNDAVTRGNENLQVFAETAGMSAEEFQTKWKDDAGAAFTEFVNGLGRAGSGATQILDNVGLNSERVRATFLSLAGAGDLLTRTMDTGNDAWLENSALTEEAQQRYNTLASRINKLKNRMIALGISLGDALTPAVEDGIDYVEQLTESFENLSADAKKNVLQIAALFAAGGPLMWAIAKFAKAIQGLVVFIKSKFFLISLAFAAGVGAGQWLIDNWDKFAAKFEMNMRFMENAATQAALGILKVWKGWFNAITNIAPPEFLSNIFGIDLSEMALDFAGVNNLIDTLEGNIESNGKDMADAMTRYYSAPTTGFFESAKKGLGALTTAVTNMVKDVTSDTALADFLDLIGGKFEDTAKKSEESAERIEESMKKIATRAVPRATFGSTPEAPAIGGAVSGGDTKEILPPIAISSISDLQKRMARLNQEMMNTPLANKERFAQLKGQIADLQLKIEGTTQGLNFMKGVADTFTSSFGAGMANVVVQGEKLVDTLKNIGKLMASSVIQKAISVFLTGGLGGSGFFGSVGGLFGKIFGRDIGGPVSAGSPYLIGKGPHQELFVPDRSGSIIGPNRLRGSGGGSGKQYAYINVNMDSRVVARQLVELEYKRAR
jgi:TP901 family phage tail tape measure protein